MTFFSQSWRHHSLCAPRHITARLDGEIRVHNDRINTVSIEIDGRRVGRVHAGKSRVFRNIPNGVRLVNVVGKYAEPQERRVTVPIASTAQLKVTAIHGRASIKNNSRVSLKLLVDGRHETILAPGAMHRTSRMRTGTHRIEAYPIASSSRGSVSMKKTFIVRPGQTARVELGRFMADVRVSNPYDRRVRVWVDGDRKLRLGPYETATVTGLLPGRHTIEMKKRGRVLNRMELKLNHGQVARWSPLARYRGRVSVANNAQHSISVTVGGHVMQQVAPGESAMFEGLVPGEHRVLIVRRRGRIEERVVGVAEHQVARVSVGRLGSRQATRNHNRTRVVARR